MVEGVSTIVPKRQEKVTRLDSKGNPYTGPREVEIVSMSLLDVGKYNPHQSKREKEKRLARNHNS